MNEFATEPMQAVLVVLPVDVVACFDLSLRANVGNEAFLLEFPQATSIYCRNILVQP